MSKLMQLKGLANKVHRSGFDLSQRVLFTAKVGQIIPVTTFEVLPGDKFSIDLNSFGRTAPLASASFARLREYYDVYFVPYRLLYSNFNNSISLINNPTKASSPIANVNNSEDLPFITKGAIQEYLNTLTSYPNEGGEDRRDATIRLLEYLGYGHYNEYNEDLSTDFYRFAMNLFPLLGYQKIYSDYFRFAQWEDSQAYTYNVDYLSTTPSKQFVPSSNLKSVKNIFDLQYCNYDKDYFHGLLPRPQYGDTALASVSLPSDIGGSIGLTLLADSAQTGDTPITARRVSDKGYEMHTIAQAGAVPVSELNTTFKAILNDEYKGNLSVLSLRYAEMFQKWKEITLSSDDLSFKSMLEKHWNVSTSNILSDRCSYIGGISKDVQIGEVINTNLADPDSEANIRGKGTVNSNGHIEFDAKDFNNEYGMLYVIYHCKPLIEWSFTSLNLPQILRTKASSYPVPEFDSIGMQGIPKIQFVNFGTEPNDIEQLSESAGYAPQYFEYKTNLDVVKGGFERSLACWALTYNVLSDFGDAPNFKLDYQDFKVKPSIVNSLFAAGVNGRYSSDHMRNSCFVNAKVVRNLDFNGLPY